jgi:hypothetical protein
MCEMIRKLNLMVNMNYFYSKLSLQIAHTMEILHLFSPFVIIGKFFT